MSGTAISRSDVENVRRSVADLSSLVNHASGLTYTITSSNATVSLDHEQFLSVFKVLATVATKAGALALLDVGILKTREQDPADSSVPDNETADEELTPQEAAAILRMSRPTVMRLIGKGLLPVRMVGSHHRLLRRQVIAYRDQNAVVRRDALDNLAKMTEDYDF